MNDYKQLRIYLIRKFILVIVMLSVVEYAVMKLLNRTIIASMMQAFFEGSDMDEIGMSGIVLIVLAVSLSLLMELVRLFIPSVFSAQISGIDDFLRSITNSNNDENEIVNVSNHLSVSSEIILVMMMLAIFIVAITPYVIGAVYYVRVVFREFRKIEAAEKQRQLEYERKRNLMLSDIAHDLRTPITTVSGYSKALSDGMVSEDRKQEYLNAIQAKSERMNDLITLLFDYVRVDSEGFKLNKTKLDICEIVRESAAMMYQDIEDAGMTLDVDIPEEQIYVQADKIQFERVVTNLITNAIRHNKPGTEIGVYLQNEDDNTKIMIADTGEMIPEEKVETIFNPFVMGDESRKSGGGTGLGLSIAKKVVELHGFTIRLVQKPYIARYDILKRFNKSFIIIISK